MLFRSYVINEHSKYANKLSLHGGLMANHPILNAYSWFGVFKEDLETVSDLINNNLTCDQNFKAQIGNYLKSTKNFPSEEQVKNLCEYADKHDLLYGGNNWQSIYPKIANYSNSILNKLGRT